MLESINNDQTEARNHLYLNALSITEYMLLVLPIIFLANTIVEPLAMMIEDLNATIACATMFASIPDSCFTDSAIMFQIIAMNAAVIALACLIPRKDVFTFGAAALLDHQ